jgi:hypothetical protein
MGAARKSDYEHKPFKAIFIKTLLSFGIIWYISCFSYCDVHAVGQQSTVETLVYNRCYATQQSDELLFSLGSVPVMTSYNSIGIGDGVFFVVCSRAI